jgi:hypothetical protein
VEAGKNENATAGTAVVLTGKMPVLLKMRLAQWFSSIA